MLRPPFEKVDVVIAGAGAVGLAIASEIAGRDREIYVLEKEKSYGQATSSRNSEVIHAGIYYPEGSLKAELCVMVNPMIYEICEENNIPHRRVGKIIVANGEEEIRQLEEIIVKARGNGARDLELIDEDRVRELEPRVKADAAILSPTTGIVDAYGLMDHFHW
ncbi:MAG: FAD-dependent oxidoreductase [Candidatus Bathyarchaeota archaeon]|nr:MAG: FAD-dependent oxidoreductase [Candidatus Bathyarchaeota archaeon]